MAQRGAGTTHESSPDWVEGRDVGTLHGIEALLTARIDGEDVETSWFERVVVHRGAGELAFGRSLSPGTKVGN